MPVVDAVTTPLDTNLVKEAAAELRRLKERIVQEAIDRDTSDAILNNHINTFSAYYQTLPLAELNTLYVNIADVNTVAGNITDVTANADNLSAIQAAPSYAASALESEVNAAQSATTAFNSISTLGSMQAQANALLGLGIGTSFIDANGDFILSYSDAAITSVAFNANGELIITY